MNKPIPTTLEYYELFEIGDYLETVMDPDKAREFVELVILECSNDSYKKFYYTVDEEWNDEEENELVKEAAGLMGWLTEGSNEVEVTFWVSW